MDPLIDYLAMGGYAAFVWPAYGFTALVMAGLALASRRALRQARVELAVLEAGDQGARRARRLPPSGTPT